MNNLQIFFNIILVFCYCLCENVIDMDDFLSPDYMPTTLLMLENPTSNKTAKYLNTTFVSGFDGSLDKAIMTMGYHREMMNEYLCRNFVAEQIVQDMSMSKMDKRMGVVSHGPGMSTMKSAESKATQTGLLEDEGSSNYKDWLSKSTTLEDIYKHYDMDKRSDAAKENEEKDDEEFDEQVIGYGYAYQPKPSQAPAKLGHSGEGVFISPEGGGGYQHPHPPGSGAGYFGGSSYGGHSGGGSYGGGHHPVIHEQVIHVPKHHHHVKYIDKKEGLTELFEIALTALAFLSFGMFIVHVVMCISMTTNTTTTAMGMMMPTNTGNAETSTQGMEELGGGETPGGMMTDMGEDVGGNDMGEGVTEGDVGGGGETGEGGEVGGDDMVGGGGTDIDEGVGDDTGGDMGSSDTGGGNGGDEMEGGGENNGGEEMGGAGENDAAGDNNGVENMTGDEEGGVDAGDDMGGDDMEMTDEEGMDNTGGDNDAAPPVNEESDTENGGEITDIDEADQPSSSDGGSENEMPGGGENDNGVGETEAGGGDMDDNLDIDSERIKDLFFLNGDFRSQLLRKKILDRLGVIGANEQRSILVTESGLYDSNQKKGTGTATGGMNTGGMNTGGMNTGGMNTGGTATGGTATGSRIEADDGITVETEEAAEIPVGPAFDGMGSYGGTHYRRKRDIPAVKVVDPNNYDLNELARRILISIEAATLASVDNGVCLRKSLCENNRYSRQLVDTNKIWIPVWSLGMSWLTSRLGVGGQSSASMLDSLKASILGLGKAKCEIIYQNCDFRRRRRKSRRSMGKNRN